MGKWWRQVFDGLAMVGVSTWAVDLALRSDTPPRETLLWGVLLGLCLGIFLPKIFNALLDIKWPEPVAKIINSIQSFVKRTAVAGYWFVFASVGLGYIIYLTITNGWWGMAMTFAILAPPLGLFLYFGGLGHARKFYKSLFGKS